MNQRALNLQRFDTDITEDVNIKVITEYVLCQLLAIGLENTALTNQTSFNALFQIQSSQGCYRTMKETTVKLTLGQALKKEQEVPVRIRNRGTSDIVGVRGSALLGSAVWTEI